METLILVARKCLGFKKFHTKTVTIGTGYRSHHERLSGERVGQQSKVLLTAHTPSWSSSEDTFSLQSAPMWPHSFRNPVRLIWSRYAQQVNLHRMMQPVKYPIYNVFKDTHSKQAKLTAWSLFLVYQPKWLLSITFHNTLAVKSFHTH